MLQIATGKFFRDVELTETHHRGVFYSNYRQVRGGDIETCVDRLLGSTSWVGLATLTYEVTERLEALNRDGSRSTMISTGGSELINDFAAVISFALNVTCAPDQDLTRRLLSDRILTPGVSHLPGQFLRRTFDAQVFATQESNSYLVEFTRRLVALERTAYEGAIRAIRQYVVATHRLADSPELAYTLFVTALESIAQGHDGYVPKWRDVDDQKRSKVDAELSEMPETKADGIREAILAFEYPSLQRRFKIFVLDHLQPEYFREEAAGLAVPVGRSVAPRVLDAAYGVRSRYLHKLSRLPGILMVPADNLEVVGDGSAEYLTFGGLARMARHVITSFIMRKPAGGKFEFNYRVALPNVIAIPTAQRRPMDPVENAPRFPQRPQARRRGKRQLIHHSSGRY